MDKLERTLIKVGIAHSPIDDCHPCDILVPLPTLLICVVVGVVLVIFSCLVMVLFCRAQFRIRELSNNQYQRLGDSNPELNNNNNNTNNNLIF